MELKFRAYRSVPGRLVDLKILGMGGFFGVCNKGPLGFGKVAGMRMSEVES